jgi:ferrous iron transport protein A
VTTTEESCTERTLDDARLDEALRVLDVRPGDTPAEWVRWLQDFGFIAGEPLAVIARGAPGGEPLVVRIGASTIALRRAEARCVRVTGR